MGDNGAKSGGGGAVSDDYSKTMQSKMGTALTYRHEDGMNFAQYTPKLIVGSCLQKPEDADALLKEGVSVVLCLQEDPDMAHFGLDILPIQKRAAELGIAHAREPIRDFDPFSFRNGVARAVRRLAAELAAHPGKGYIHCTAGMGRAPGVAVAYRYWVDGVGIEDAREELLKVRACHPQMDAIRAATCDLLAGGEGGTRPVKIAVTQPGASKVEIAGLDVGWGNRLQLAPGGAAGLFTLDRELLPGAYTFKLVVDGDWRCCDEYPQVSDGSNVNNNLAVAANDGDPEEAERRTRIMAPGGRPTEDEWKKLRALLGVA